MSALLSPIIGLVRRARARVPPTFRNIWVIYCFVLAAVLLDDLNVGGTITSTTSIEKLLHTSSSTASWVLSGYSLTLGAFIILFGKIADIIGVHKVFLGGVLGVSITALLSAVVTDSVITVIVLRALQGIAGAALLPSGYALTGNYFEGKQREWALKAFSFTLTMSFGVGMILGGAFAETKIGYRGFFFFTAGFSFVSFICLVFIIIPVTETEGHRNLKLRNLNYGGVIMLVIGLLLVIFGMTEAASSWNSPRVYVPIPLGALIVVLIFLFENIYLKKYKAKHANKAPVSDKAITNEPVSDDGTNNIGSTSTNINVFTTKEDSNNDYIELKNVCPTNDESFKTEDVKEETVVHDWRLHMDDLLPPEIFKYNNFYVFFFGLFLKFVSYISILVILVQYFQVVEYNSPLLAAVKLLPYTIGLIAASALYSDDLIHKIGFRTSFIFTGVISAGSAIWISRMDYRVANEYWRFHLVSIFIAGFSLDLYYLLYLSSIMGETPAHLHGIVTGVFLTGAQVGVSIASAAIATILGNIEIGTKGDPQERHKLFEKFRDAMYFLVAVDCLFLVLMFFVKKPKDKKSQKSQKKIAHLDGQASSSVV